MITAPTLNMNGSTGNSLLWDIGNAIQAINAAYDAMSKCHPHGRDYQTAPDSADAYTRAAEEHRSRLQTLTEVGQQYEELAEKIHAQMKEQTRAS